MKLSSIAIVALLVASAVYAAGKPSEVFLKNAVEGNYYEIEMGKLAHQNGQSDNVKKFGQMLSDDHSAANQKALDVAKSMGMTPPDGSNAKQKATYDKLSKLNGPRGAH